MPSRPSILTLLTFFALVPLALGAARASEPDRGSEAGSARIVAVWAEVPRFEDLAQRTAAEIASLLRPEAGRWQVESIPPPAGSDAADRLSAAAAAGASIAVPVGTAPGFQETADPTIPVVIPVVRVDPLGWLPASASPEGHERRVTAISLVDAVASDLEALAYLLTQTSVRISPEEPEVLVLMDPWLTPATAAIRQAGQGAAVTLHLAEIGPEEPGSSTDWEEWLGARARTAAAVYLPPGLAIDATTLAPALEALALPSFSGRGRVDVENGLLAARADRQPQRLARLAGLEVLALVRGLPPNIPPAIPSAIPSAIPPELHATESHGLETRLVLHLAAAEGLGKILPWRIRLMAETVGEPSMDPAATTVAQARLEAVEANLDVRARSLTTAASEQEIERALAQLRPQVTLGASARWSDQDSAAAAFGSRPERLVTALGEASWLLFSEDARAAVDGVRRTQAARELELRELELDIGLEASSTLLATARAHAFEAIERDHLRLTLADLDTARARRQVGAGGRADVARLEARAARDRGSLVQARGDRRGFEVRFNRLLARPLEQRVTPRIEGFPEEPSTEAEAVPASLPLEEIVSRPAGFTALGRELLARARKQAPEIAAAGEIVHARQRELLAARRAFVLPTARATGQLSSWLVDSGAGTEPPPLGEAASFPETPDTSWTLGLDLSLPLFTGGSRNARRTRAELDLEAARTLLASAKERVEERVHLALTALESAYEAAAQNRLAAAAALDAFTVINEGYRQGSESLTTLLDAQTELLEARQRRAAAAYDALTRWLEVQRATGEFLDPAGEAALAILATSPNAVRHPADPTSRLDSRPHSIFGGQATSRAPQEKP